MNDVKLMIGGREIPLRFKMKEFKELEERLGNLGEIKEIILEENKRIENIIFIIMVLGNGGLKAAGEKPDLTEEWLGDNMEPYQLATYQLAALACISKENDSQAKNEKNESEERDLVLEEIEAKKDPVN